MDPTAKLICGFRGLINEKLNRGEIREKLEKIFRF